VQRNSIFVKEIRWQQIRIICCKWKHTSCHSCMWNLPPDGRRPLCSLWRIII